MFEKLNEMKVFRDPIHGYIHIDDKVIWECVGAREFQRLHRIHQLGTSFMVYPSAEHSRFVHSLGVYEIVRRMITEVSDLANCLSERDKIVVMLAGLLHDIGHGPFSHAFESICTINHEQFTVNIITKDSEIHTILENTAEGLSEEVAAVITHTHKNKLLSQLISGQLDADRMDYLLRDAYFTGTKYGEFDLERILRTLRVSNNRIVIKESAMHTVEDYIMARYHMYWQVYYHPVARSAEALLVGIFKRLVDIKDERPDILDLVKPFKPFLNPEVSNEDHFLLDENVCQYMFSVLSKTDDPVLSDLGRRIRDRDLLKYESLTGDELEEEIINCTIKAGFDPKYYVYKDVLRQQPYLPYNKRNQQNIFIKMSDGKICELHKASVIVESLSKGKNLNEYKIFYPKEIEGLR
ncbi:MAG: HD domain-containing protein [Erysipelotrichaceae bacterium]|nr:HD domain-containing protein [Erysipelotrichaceae bacterium]